MRTMTYEQALDLMFREARTHRSWLDRPVSDETLRQVWELAKMGPTSTNCLPLRVLFVRSPEAKARLRPCLDPGNVPPTMAAPVTAILAHDLEFFEQLPRLVLHTDARSWFVGKPELVETTAFRNGTLQAAYFILAARAVGLDCGPMSGFDNAAVDREFFAGTAIRSNFLCNLGYGDPSKLFPRAPRLGFDEVARII
ncbi:MAG TPA: malonic semialdehyde reductase [Thermoanaerobaculaceae bacterium]|nr:malonic semialdehyde reductase [Thermoanaerobaculaceae bacterium]HRS17230.1 malonic semialdehyde reductase [Thermoanaerobaculaceae bacterium]